MIKISLKTERRFASVCDMDAVDESASDFALVLCDLIKMACLLSTELSLAATINRLGEHGVFDAENSDPEYEVARTRFFEAAGDFEVAHNAMVARLRRRCGIDPAEGAVS